MIDVATPAAFVFCFDRGVETLVFIDNGEKKIFAWLREQWAAAGFTLDGLRGLPPVPRQLHQSIEAATRKGVIR